MDAMHVMLDLYVYVYCTRDTYADGYLTTNPF